MRKVKHLTASAAFFVCSLLCATHIPQALGASNPDDAAKLLAGVQPSAASPASALARSSNWQERARRFDAAWRNLDRQQLSRIRSWSKENLKSSPAAPVFYFFSGPDFLYADAFFPDASTFVLAGLEPVGAVPELTGQSGGLLASGMAHTESSLRTVLSHSFFITKEMRSKLHAGRFSGALPILYVFLARSGKTIKSVNYVTFDAEGALLDDDGARPQGSPRGVKIVFSNREGREQTLYYFSTDLSNDGVKKSGFLKFCKTFGAGRALIKSASYLPHSDAFSSARQFILDNAVEIVQDDTGVPVRFFKSEEWELHPFGRYVSPIGIFSRNTQPRLREVFRKAHAKPLAFGIGYKWRPHESNLLLSRKKAAPSS